MGKPYGWELILDIHGCNPAKFTRKDITRFFIALCKLIDMQREDLRFWDYEGMPEEYTAAPAHLKGTSAVQFIKTSTIVIHTLDVLKRVYLNVFSCKAFDPDIVVKYAQEYFGGIAERHSFLERE